MEVHAFYDPFYNRAGVSPWSGHITGAILHSGGAGGIIILQVLGTQYHIDRHRHQGGRVNRYSSLSNCEGQ